MADGIKKVSENVIMDRRALVITDPAVIDNDAIAIGALQSNPNTKGLKIKTAKNTYSLFDASQFIMPGSISTELLKDKCVTSLKLADKSVTQPKLADNVVSERTIMDSNVTENKIAPQAITEEKIKDLAIATRHYKNESIVNSKIGNNTIENSKLLNKTITNVKIADGTIINSLLAPNSVKELNIAENSIKYEHLKDGSIYDTKIKNAAIKNKHLDVNCINSQNILNGAITSNKIANNQILGSHIASNVIESTHIVNQSITKEKLDTESVSTNAIINKAITKYKLADDIIELIGDPVQYDTDNNVQLRKDLSVKGNASIDGNLTANRVFNAVFMDIAEAYIPGEELEPGDIVEIREDNQVYKCKEFSLSVVGVVSDQYAVCYGATEKELQEGTKVAVGLIGKVPVKVVGTVYPGDRILAGENGVGYVISKEEYSEMTTLKNKYSPIGKVIEYKKSDGIQTALCLIYPN